MTEKQQKIIDMFIKLYMEKGEPVGLTEIGLALGQEYQSASSYCSQALKKAVNQGLAKKTVKGKYVPIIN